MRAEERASPEPEPSRASVPGRLLLAVLLGGAALRLAYAATASGIFHPDEIYQSLEPAHGVVYGVGFRAWEMVAGARPWSTPGVYVLLLALLKGLGITRPEGYLLVVRLFDALVAATWPWLCFRMGRALRSPRAGLLAATFAASWYFLILLAPHPLNHCFSVTFALWGLARLLEGTRDGNTHWSVFATGALLGVGIAFRYQEALVLVGAVAFLVAERRWREAPALLAGAALPMLGVGLLDQLTWGTAFHSLFAYLHANLAENAAGRFGVMPAWFYAWHVPASLGGAALLLLLLPLAGRRAWRLMLSVALLMLLAHSLTDNKQLRFVLPALLVLLCGLGCAADALLERMARRSARLAAVLAAGLLSLWLAASAGAATDLTFDDLGVFSGQPESAESPWSFRRDLDRALAKVGRDPELCGLVIYPFGGSAGSARLATTGGYTNLHRAVPITMGPLADEARAFTSHALVCADLQGRVMALPGFVESDRVGKCRVLRNPGLRCDRAAAETFLAPARW
jgi:phosphatidylinositol glycan class B